jgi:hypothetical protein
VYFFLSNKEEITFVFCTLLYNTCAWLLFDYFVNTVIIIRFNSVLEKLSINNCPCKIHVSNRVRKYRFFLNSLHIRKPIIDAISHTELSVLAGSLSL